AAQLWKIKQPYNVNLAALVAALASLEDAEHLPQTVARIVGERERLAVGLRELSWLHVYPSRANFVLCRVTHGDAAQIKQALDKQGILVRYYRKPDLRDCIRISVGTPDQNERLLAALRAMGG
ncbi:MAG: aminotransferase class I/II-fold pyridoxal phosphate-dependent enzyme, partial [Chloroflexaceae bacterium]|nr:aminotransferase class I/II-fold pyridoxal phosphate-dependent enzyme [Chloroflexaceae bacterium]